jgi:hypothetical protein
VCAVRDARGAVSAETAAMAVAADARAVARQPNPLWLLISRVNTFCLLELRRIRHDRTELYTRAIQPALWLLIFGEAFTRPRALSSTGCPRTRSGNIHPSSARLHPTEPMSVSTCSPRSMALRRCCT